MKNLFFLFLFIAMQNCTNEKKEMVVENPCQEFQEFTNDNDSSINEEYRSYYGFVIKNSSQHNFYRLDKEIMLKYVSNLEVDSITMKRDILSSTWFSPVIGTSYDYFVWINFINSELLTDAMDFEVCNLKKSQIIPVYITQFNRNLDNTKSKVPAGDECFLSELYQQRSLNLIYIIPLNYEMANKYLDIRDTLSREKYRTFIRSKIH